MKQHIVPLLLFIGLAFFGCEDDNTTEQEDHTPLIEGRKVYISGFYQEYDPLVL
jgi:hypothetical protein